MENIDFFENTSIRLIDNEVYASRKQLQELYNVPKQTLIDSINVLKSDGLIKGTKIRTLAKDNKNREFEVFNLSEIIALGMRLRSDNAIKFQIWAIHQLKEIILKQNEEIKQAQIMESIAWNHLDAKENHRR
jgi:hypothetical protein